MCTVYIQYIYTIYIYASNYASVCMYVYIYIGVYMYNMYVQYCIRIHVSINVCYLCVYWCMCACMNTCTYVGMFVCHSRLFSVNRESTAFPQCHIFHLYRVHTDSHRLHLLRFTQPEFFFFFLNQPFGNLFFINIFHYQLPVQYVNMCVCLPEYKE